MGDLTDPRLMYLKACLFLVAGLLAAAGILVENPTLLTACLLAVVAVSFARLYYFCFYVIEHYIDSDYRFAGLWSVVGYLAKGSKEPDRRPS